MRDDDVLSGAERRLRVMLRPDDERVTDVINRALSPERRIRSGWRGRVLVLTTVAVLVLAAMWRASTPRPAALTISGSGSVIVVTSEDGRRWILDERNESEPRGQFAIAVPQ